MKLGQIVDEELKSVGGERRGELNLDRDSFRSSVVDWIFKLGGVIPPSDDILQEDVVTEAAERVGIGGNHIIDIVMNCDIPDSSVPVFRIAINKHIRDTLALDISLAIAKAEAEIVAEGGDPNETLEEAIERFKEKEKKSQS